MINNIDLNIMSSKELPSDLVLEILTRVRSLKTLDTCKLVCQSWYKLIHDPKFMHIYCQRTRNLSGYFIQYKIRPVYRCLTKFVAIDQLQEGKGSILLPADDFDDFKILASCNQGILCCLMGRTQYYACKPSTRQWQLLPESDIRHQTVAIAIMVLSSSPLRYKIVRLSDQGDQEYRSIKSYKCEIFDSKIWTWKEAQDVNLPRKEFITLPSTTLSTCNSIYWLTTHDNVLTFHEPQETFHKFQLPQEVVKNRNNYSYKYKKLVECQGGLGLIICNLKERGDTELWLTYKNSINWMEKMVMDKENNMVRSGITHPSSYVGRFYNDAIEFLKVFYESRLEANNEMKIGREFFRFRSDLEPVDLGKLDFGLIWSRLILEIR